MKHFNFIWIAAISLFMVVGCKNENSKHESIDSKEIKFTKDGELTFENAQDSVLKTLDIEVADTDYKQQTGLMYRKHMKENRGMLFPYEHEKPRPSFYMKNTYIPLDIIYINADKEIVDINANAKPRDETPLDSDAKAKYVVEINGGMVDKWGLELGDKVSFDYK